MQSAPFLSKTFSIEKLTQCFSCQHTVKKSKLVNNVAVHVKSDGNCMYNSDSNGLYGSDSFLVNFSLKPALTWPRVATKLTLFFQAQILVCFLGFLMLPFNLLARFEHFRVQTT